MSIMLVILIGAVLAFASAMEASYDEIRGNLPAVQFPGCSAKVLWSYVSDGRSYKLGDQEFALEKRLANTRDTILVNHNKYGGGELSAEELEALQAWTFPENVPISISAPSKVKTLTINQMTSFGSRLGKAFSGILSQNVKVRYTSDETSKFNAAAVLNGMYGKKQGQYSSAIDDRLLKFGGNYNGITTTETAKATRSEEVATVPATEEQAASKTEELSRDVSKRLGYEYDLDYALIQDMFEMCRFGKASASKSSPWCAAFTDEQSQVLEKEREIVAKPVEFDENKSAKLGCTLNRDIHSTLYDYFNFVQLMKGVQSKINFADKEGLVNLLSSLKLNPSLRSSSANLVAVLYHCNNGLMPLPIYHEWKVGVFVNERLVQLPYCKSQDGLCVYNEFSKYYYC